MDISGRAMNKSTELDSFVRDVEFIKDDINAMEKLQKKLEDLNEQSKNIQGLTGMKEIRSRMEVDIDHVLKLAKNIMSRLEGLERTLNAEHRKVSGTASSLDRSRMSIVIDLGKKLREVMDEFQGMRVKIAAVHKEAVEFRYYSITGEKQYVETIEGLVSSREIEAFLAEAMEEQGSGRVLEVVQEIQERRDGVKHIQNCLADLHQILLDMVAMAESQGQKIGAADNRMANGRENSFVRPTAAQLGDLEDYDRDAKKRATMALVLVVALMFILIVPLFKLESDTSQE